MLAGLLYEDALSFFRHFDHSNGLFPDDVLEALDDLGIAYRLMSRLPKRQPALVAVGWREDGYSGHYMVWDPERGQLLDPTHGLIDRRDLSRFCVIEHIWATGKSNMRNFVRARMAKEFARRIFRPFGPTALGLSRTTDSFVVEVSFASEPPAEVRAIVSVKGFPVHIRIADPAGQEE